MLNMHPEKLEGLVFLKILCNHFESPLFPGEFLLTRGFLLKTFEIDDQVEWELEKPSPQRIILKKLDWLMTKIKAKLLKKKL